MVLENLFDLFETIVQYTYFSLKNLRYNEKKEGNLNKLYFFINRIDQFYQLKLPQNFFRDYLEKIIETIINLFYLISYNNPVTSAFFLKRFDTFYYLMYFYKRFILQFLKEITSNSSQMNGEHQNVLNTLFNDLELPTFKKKFMERHSDKLQFMKNLVKNLSKNKTIENMNAIGEIVQNFSVGFDRNFYIQFDQNDENDEFICKFYIVKFINIDNLDKRAKIRKIKANIMKIFSEYCDESEQDNENFDIIQVRIEGINQQEEFHHFLKYYIKLKSRLFYTNLKMGTMLLGLKSLEEDPSKQVLFKMVVQKGLDFNIKSGIVSFIAKVYLFFHKYNYFIDDYDFTYFCQKLNRIKMDAFFKERPIKMMNPEITNYSEELFDIENARGFSVTSLENQKKSFEIAVRNNYIEITEMEEFYQSLIDDVEQNIINFIIPKDITQESINQVILLFKNAINTFSLIEEFFKIGYPTFQETVKIISIIDNYVSYLLNKIMIWADKANPDETTSEISIIIFTKYKTLHNFLMEVSLILKKINLYRTNMITTIIIKFFYTLAIKQSFSVNITNTFVNHLQPLINFFDFEHETKETTSENPGKKVYTVEQFGKLSKFFKKMLDTNQNENTEAAEKIMSIIMSEYRNLEQFGTTKICSNLTKTMLIIINKGDLAYKRMKNKIHKSLHQFDELYYMKILKREILQVIEEYYLRSIKVVSKLRDVQIIFDDTNLYDIMNMVEYDPEQLQVLTDNLKKEDYSISQVIDEGKFLVDQIKNINKKMTEQYLNKIYFKKMQKMVQISKLPQICLEMMNKIYKYIKKSQNENQKNVDNEESLPRASNVTRAVEIPTDVRNLFFELKRFFVLLMIKSKKKIVENSEKLKDRCIDVFIENGFECDDLIIELNQYLDHTIIQEELQNFFKFLEDSELFKHFDNINPHNISQIVGSSGILKLRCQTIEQYFNILRNLTFHPDKEVRSMFQSQIINNILQTNLMKKISDKDFVVNFCFEVKEKIPKLKTKLFAYRPIMRANTYTNNQTKYTLIIKTVSKVFKNLLELVSNCMKENTFCKLVFSNQIKYQEIFEILKIKRLPLFLKTYFYRIIFDSYFSSGRVPFKKVITLIDKILLDELRVLIQYSKFHQKNIRNVPRFTALDQGIKKRIAKKLKLNSEDLDIGELYDNEEDQLEQDQLENDLNEESEGSIHEDEQGSDNEGDQAPARDLSKEIEVFNAETGVLETMWFENDELKSFLGEKLKNNQIDGFIPFIADLITFMLFNIRKKKEVLSRSKLVLNDFYSQLNDFYFLFQDFKKNFNSEIYSHTELLLFISIKNLYILREKTGCLEVNENKTQSAIRSFHTSNDISILNIDRFFGTGKRFDEDKLQVIAEDDEEDTEPNNLSQQTVELHRGQLDRKAEEILKLIRHSLISLKLTFSEVLKDLFEDELVDLESKLIKLIEKLIENAKLIKYNFFITLESNNSIDISYEDITQIFRFLFYKMKNSNDLDLGNLKEDLSAPLNEIETINLIIKLNQILYKKEEKKKQISIENFARVESFTEIELADYLISIENIQRDNFNTLENFLINQSFYSMFLNLNEFNILESQREQLKNNPYTHLLQQLLFKDDLQTFQMLFRRKSIEKCLSNKTSRFFYIHSLKNTIQNELSTLQIGNQFAKEDYMGDLNGKQTLLNNKYVAYFCISLMIEKKNEGEIIISECLDILYMMLVFGNQLVQMDLYRIITNNYGKINLVEFLEKHLNTHAKIIKDRMFGNQVYQKNVFDINNEQLVRKRFLAIDSFRVLVSILRFLQVLNENCFTQFQDMFREQKFFNQNTNNNLIQKIINIIINFGEFIPFLDNSNPKKVEGNVSVVAGEMTDTELETDVESENFKSKGIIYSEEMRQKRKIYKSQGFEKMVTLKRDDLKKKKKQEKKNGQLVLSFLDSIKLKSLIHYAFFYINDSMMGPNKKNQQIILSNHGLIEFAISIIKEMKFPQISKGLDNVTEFDFNMYDYLLFSDAVQLLLYSTDIFDKTETYKEIFRQEIIDLVKEKMQEIYDNIIHENKYMLYSNSFCPEMESEFSINQNSLDDVNLSNKSNLIRNDIFGNSVETLLSVPVDRSDPNFEKNYLEVRKLLLKVIIAGHNLFIFYKRAQTYYNDDEKIKEEYFGFYDKFFGYVELKHNETIEILRYTKPYLTYFHYDSPKLVNEFSIEPHNEKINNFIDRVDKEEEQLLLRQNLYRLSRPIYYMSKNKHFVEYLFYLIILIINLLFIFNAAHVYDGDLNVTDLNLKRGSRFFDDSLNVSVILLFGLGVLNFLLAVLIFFFNVIESIPETKFYWKSLHVEYENETIALRKKKYKGFLLVYLEIMSFISMTKYTGIGYWLNFRNVYNIIIMGLSMTSIFFPLLYPFLLLDIIQRSETLRNIVKSITNNWEQLIQTTIVTLIIMYIYAAISFTYFPDQYGHTDDDDFMNYCHTLSQCFFSVLNNGLRAGGGLGEALGQPTIEDTRYVLRYWVDLTFMIIILIILLNIVFGIIIDTFGDMRNARDEWNNYINNTCLLCDLTKGEIDSKGEGYYKHINLSHSVEDYVHFLVYIKNRNLNDCDGMEQKVKIKYTDSDYTFLPHQESFYYNQNTKNN